MKRVTKILTVSLVAVLIMGLGITGCARKPAVPAPTPKPMPAPSGETAEDILALAAGSMKYDLVMVYYAPGQPAVTPAATQKVWVKGKNTRIEATAQGETVVTILNMDKEVVYWYFPADNTATMQGWRVSVQGIKARLQPSPLELAKEIAAMGPTVVGSETIDGKECLVIQATFKGQTTKFWVWKKYGFPIRQETPEPARTLIVEYKNIKLVNIPDSMFELPAGVQPLVIL